MELIVVGFIVVVSSNTTLPLTTLNTVVLPLTVVILWVLFWKLILLWLLFSMTLFESELFESVLVTLCELLFEFVFILLLLTLLSDKSEEKRQMTVRGTIPNPLIALRRLRPIYQRWRIISEFWQSGNGIRIIFSEKKTFAEKKTQRHKDKGKG